MLKNQISMGHLVYQGGTRECGTPSHLNNTEINQDVPCEAI